MGPLWPGRGGGSLLALPGARAGRREFPAAPASAPTALFAFSYLAGGTVAAYNALHRLVLERTVSVDFLMITAAIGVALVGHWEEGAILLGLFSTSNALEHHALGRTQRAVRALMELSPIVATCLSDEQERTVPVEELRLGDLVLVRPGERVAVDGTVLAGDTAIVRGARERGLPLEEPLAFRAFPGQGIYARVDGDEVLVGNAMLFAEFGETVPPAAEHVANRLRDEGKTAVFVGDRQTVRGLVAVADTLRSSARSAVQALHAAEITRIVVLTGDNQRVADAICSELGIVEVYADLLPQEKLRSIEDLKRTGPGTMVGDGVNDAPALATASIGVAMGGAGTDVTLETADVVLMADDLSKLPYAIDLSRRTRRTVRQNLGFSLAVIVTLVAATLTRGIPLPLGVVGHEGSTVIVVLNGLRLLLTPSTTSGAALIEHRETHDGAAPSSSAHPFG